jgi:hypothetical protein
MGVSRAEVKSELKRSSSQHPSEDFKNWEEVVLEVNRLGLEKFFEV